MSEIGWILLFVVIALVAAVAFFAVKVRPRQHLKKQFGPEYDHVVAKQGDRKRAEAELALREMRVSRLTIRTLTPGEREEFKRAWLNQQAAFVDEPARAVADSDHLISRVMEVRGYPVQQAADLSVRHPQVVKEYRLAHAIEIARQKGRANTEDLRQALVHYRTLFAELIEEPVTTASIDPRPSAPVHATPDLSGTSPWR